MVWKSKTGDVIGREQDFFNFNSQHPIFQASKYSPIPGKSNGGTSWQRFFQTGHFLFHRSILDSSPSQDDSGEGLVLNLQA